MKLLEVTIPSIDYVSSTQESSTQEAHIHVDIATNFSPPGSFAFNPIVIDSENDENVNVVVPYVHQPGNRHRRISVHPILFPDLNEEIDLVEVGVGDRIIEREIVQVEVPPEAHQVLFDDNVAAVSVRNEEVIIISSDDEDDSKMSASSGVEDM